MAHPRRGAVCGLEAVGREARAAAECPPPATTKRHLVYHVSTARWRRPGAAELPTFVELRGL